MPEGRTKGRRPRVLFWDRPPHDDGGSDEPVSKLFAPRNDPKGWDRTSITLNTHPLHREPRVTADDLRLPERSSRLKLAGDSVVLAITVLLLSAFPLWVVAVILKNDLRWAWIAAIVLAAGAGVLLFARGLSDELRPPEDFL